MKTYNVTIDFKKGESFAVTNVEAISERAAEAYALKIASGCGYHEAFKRSTITEVVTA